MDSGKDTRDTQHETIDRPVEQGDWSEEFSDEDAQFSQSAEGVRSSQHAAARDVLC